MLFRSKLHIENLLLCDAVLTYCGKTTDEWLQFKRTDLLKLPGYGRKRPLLAQAFYLSAPATDIKDRFRVHNGFVIKNYGQFSCESLTPFIERIKTESDRRKGAQS